MEYMAGLILYERCTNSIVAGYQNKLVDVE